MTIRSHPFDDDKLREECGIYGVIGLKDAANFVALGLHALQHRGQEAGGIVAWSPEQDFTAARRFGYVATLEKVVQPAVVKGRTVYRLRVNAGSGAAAAELCARLKLAGEGCFVTG